MPHPWDDPDNSPRDVFDAALGKARSFFRGVKYAGLAAFAALLVLIGAASSFYQVEPSEEAVSYSGPSTRTFSPA